MATEPPDDPLWLHSPRKRLAFRAGCYLLWVLLHALFIGSLFGGPVAHLVGAGVGLLSLLMARDWLLRLLLAPLRSLRRAPLAQLEGRHHSFAGVPLSVHDDGRHLWLHEAGLRRLLGLQRDPPDALKARFSGHWREARELGLKGRGLWLDVAAVHRYLAEAPERMDPKRVRLRHYLDRSLLQPAARRHERGG
jgi:hypothetical protein